MRDMQVINNYVNVKYKISDKTSRFLEPDSFNGNIDIISDSPWTKTPKGGRIEVPALNFKEFSITEGQMVASIIYYSKIIQRAVGDSTDFKSAASGAYNEFTGNTSPSDLYKYKYIAEPTKFTYRVPFFNSQKTSRSTSFGYEDNKSPFSSLSDLGSSVVEGFGSKTLTERFGRKYRDIAAIVPAVGGIISSLSQGKFGLENPQSWNDTDAGEYTAVFDLFNTGSVADIINNRNICHILAYQNSPSRRNFAITDSVCIYEVWAEDVFNFPAAYITNLQITNLGNTREMKLDGRLRIVPEAYKISITFKSLLQYTRQIMGEFDAGNRVEAISTAEDFVAFREKLKTSGKDTFNSTVDTIGSAFAAPQ